MQELKESFMNFFDAISSGSLEQLSQSGPSIYVMIIIAIIVAVILVDVVLPALFSVIVFIIKQIASFIGMKILKMTKEL